MSDTRKYRDVLQDVASGGFVSFDAALIALNLAVLEAEEDERISQSTVGYGAIQIERLHQWLAAHDISGGADPLSVVFGLVTNLRADLEKLQTDTNAEVAQLSADLAARDRTITVQADLLEDQRADITERDLQIGYQRGRIMELESQADGLRTSITEQDAEIQRQRDEIQRLTVRCQALAAQLEVANSPVSGNEPAFVTNDNGTGSAPAAIDWSGAPKEYLNSINKLNAGTLPGWTILTAPQRRAIALYAVRQLATEGAVTMAQFDAARPAWMPSASAVAKLFSCGWHDVVSQAVAHA